MADDPAALMRAFVRTQSPDAFAALVRLYLPVVFGAALRRSGDPTLAEDVSQLVFADFAKRMPTLRADARIGAWLHRAAVLRTADLLKSERRRKRREQQAAAMMEIDRLNKEEAAHGLGPIVDEALAGLRAADREALVLRYYEGRSLRAVGKVLGVSEAAAQKRVERALERLRSMLRKSGLAVSLTLLTEFLAERVSGFTVSAALCSRIVSAVAPKLAAPGTATWCTQHADVIRWAALGVVATLAVGSVPWFGQWQEVRELRRTSQSSVSAKSADRVVPRRSAPQRLSSRIASRSLSVSEIVDLLGEVFSEPSSALDHALVDSLLRGLEGAAAGEALTLMDERWDLVIRQRMDAACRNGEWRRSLCTIWAREDPEGALVWALKELQPGSSAYEERFTWREVLRSPLEEWAERDWEAALAWVKTGIANESLLVSEPKLDLPRTVASALQRELLKREGTQGAIDFFAMLQRHAGPCVTSDGSDALRTLIGNIESNEDARSFLNAVESLASPQDRAGSRSSLLRKWRWTDWEAAAEWVRQRPTAIERAVSGWDVGLPPEGTADLRSHLDWLCQQYPLESNPGSEASRFQRGLQHVAVHEILETWMRREPTAAVDWLLERGLAVHVAAYHVLNLVASSADGDPPVSPQWEAQAVRLMEALKRDDPQWFESKSSIALHNRRDDREAVEDLTAILAKVP